MKTANPATEIMNQSEQMLSHAREGRWSKVAKAEAFRRDLLNKLFSTSSDAADIPEINKTIEQIIAINKKLEEIALAARDEASIDLQKVREGRLAVNTYVKHI